MLEVLQFYTSGFWTWLGITIGLGIVASGVFGGLGGIVNVTVNRVAK